MNKIIIIAALAIFISSCHHNHPADLAEEKTDAIQHTETVQIEKASISSVVRIPGELKPFEKVDIYPKLNGFVKEMYVDRGSVVHKGEILMTLEAPEIAQQMESAQGTLLQAQESIGASRDRYFRLLAASKIPGSVSQLDLTSAQAKYQADSAMVQSQQANLKAAQAMQDYLIVRAPFNGVITERNVHPGALTGPNFKMEDKPLLILEDNTLLRLETFIPEVYATNIDMNDKHISFTTESLPGQVFSAPIARASHSLYDQYRSEAIEADVANPNDTFKPGMYVEAMLKVKSPVTSYVVPSTAIITTSEGKYIIAVQNGTAKYIPVKAGIASKDGKTEIFGDIKGNETVVKAASSEIRDGSDIK